MARYIAKNMCGGGIAERAEGCGSLTPSEVASVVCVWIPSGTGKSAEAVLTELVRKNFSLTPKGILRA